MSEKRVHQIDRKNEWLLLSVTFTAKHELVFVLTLFRMGRGGGGVQKGSPASFFPVTSTNIGISPQNFLTVSFTPFAMLV